MDINLFDETPTYCRHCLSTQRLYLDRSQGDIVCRDCGVVAESRIFDLGPEWLDYQNDSELDPNLTYSTQARCSMVPVNESKYIGGLESTSLSTQPYRGPSRPRTATQQGKRSSTSKSLWQEDESDPVVIANKEARIRTCLQKTHFFLERWTRKHYEEALENAKMDLEVQQQQQMKKKKRKQCGTRNNNPMETDTSSTTSSSSTISVQAHHEIDDDDRIGNPSIQDFYSEHETIVQQREYTITQMLQDTWSVTTSVFIHGSHQDSDYDASIHRYMSTSSSSSSSYDSAPTAASSISSLNLEEEKTKLWKHMNATQRRASMQLYYASRILLHTIHGLQLSQYTDTMMNVLCQYATHNHQGLTVKGVRATATTTTGTSTTILPSTAISHPDFGIIQGSGDTATTTTTTNTPLDILSHESLSSFYSRKDLLCHPQRDLNKILQMAVLSSAIIYSHCKKENIGRSVMDICSCVNGIIQKDGIQIKPKDCFKAMIELKNIVPSMESRLKKQQSTFHHPTGNNSSSSNNVDIPSTSTTLSPTITTTPTSTFDPKDLTSISTLIQHSLEPIRLPPGCLIAITYLTLDLKSREQRGQIILSTGGSNSLTMSTSHSKLMTVVLSLTYFVGQVGQVLQKLAPQIVHSKSLQGGSCNSSSSSTTTSLQQQSSANNNNIHSFDIEALDALPIKDTTHEEEEHHKLVFWNVWKNEPSWKREYETIETLPCFHTSISTLREFYKKNLSITQRRILLQNLQDDVSVQQNTNLWNVWYPCFNIQHPLEQEKIRLLFKYITLALPLMN